MKATGAPQKREYLFIAGLVPSVDKPELRRPNTSQVFDPHLVPLAELQDIVKRIGGRSFDATGTYSPAGDRKAAGDAADAYLPSLNKNIDFFEPDIGSYPVDWRWEPANGTICLHPFHDNGKGKVCISQSTVDDSDVWWQLLLIAVEK